MNEKLQDALETCLQRMEQGETLDSLLGRYPDLAVQLSPLLKAAARARSARRESLPSTVLARQRSRGLVLCSRAAPKEKPALASQGFLAHFSDGPFGDRHPGIEQQWSPGRFCSLHSRRHPVSLEAFGRIDPVAPDLRPG